MGNALAQFGKALFAGLIALLGSLATVLVGDVGLSDVTAGQWVIAALAALTAAAGVYRIPYRGVQHD